MHLDRVVLFVAVPGIVLLDVDAAAHARAAGEIDIAIVGGEFAGNFGAIDSMSPDTVLTVPPTCERSASFTLR
jgi:hypothetical protein